MNLHSRERISINRFITVEVFQVRDGTDDTKKNWHPCIEYYITEKLFND